MLHASDRASGPGGVSEDVRACLPFVKMQGLGNDFVVLDGHAPLPELTPALLRRIADRRAGIGCDQILIVDPPPEPGVDFGYRIYNADGGRVGQCGNGARCLALYIARSGLSAAREWTVQTATARMRLALEGAGVRVEMPVPDFAPASLPLTRAPADSYEFDAAPGWHFAALSLGNPHLVTEVDDVAQAPVAELGPRLATHADLPEGANVGFAQRLDARRIRLRVYERGAGETPACGSGACAAVAALVRSGRLEADAPVQVLLPGGSLEIRWAGGDVPLWMTGPADWVFEGRMPL